MNDLPRLHRILLIVLGLAALVAFVSGAGIESPFPVLAGAALLLALVWQPSVPTHERLERLLRLAALALALRAVYYVLTVPEDVVLPLVDVLFVLIASEALRPAQTTTQSRMYLLSCALLVAAAAYRAGVGFGIAFITYVSVGAVALLISHLLRESQRFGARPADLPREFLLRVGKLSAVMLLMSGLLFLAFPRVSRNWVTRGTPRAGSVVGFSDRVSLAEHGGRMYPNPEVVLRVEFPAGERPERHLLYWRGRSYDYFDGVSWMRSPRVLAARVNPRMYREQWPALRTRQKIYAVPLDVPVLFALSPTLNVTPHSTMQWSTDPSGDLWYDGVGPPVYEAISITRQPSDQTLRQNADSTARPPHDAYLQLPELSRAVYALADSLVSTRTSRLDQARAIEHWLRTQFRYTMDQPATAREATLEHFLFKRRAGHCEYFSTAMVVLLRAAGVPARNVNGFLGGDWNQFGKFVTVTQNQAHSWVEAWFPGFGWVTFDPTPAASGLSATQHKAYGPLRFLADGLEHRWNKWVLEYSMDLQVGLVRRAARAITPADAPAGPARTRPQRRVMPLLLLSLATLAGAAFLLLRRRSAGMAVSVETKLYLRLRRLYRNTGDIADHDPPLAFLRKLGIAGAPGSDSAQTFVSLYLESRFGGVDIGEAGRTRMREALSSSLRSVRQARRAN